MAPTLSELQRIPTSGARAVEAFRIGGRELLAIPQLALDVPGTPAGMNVGRQQHRDADPRAPGRRLRAVRHRCPPPAARTPSSSPSATARSWPLACIRTGSGPYDYDTESFVYEWTGERFELFQSVSTFAAKQWKHWTIGDRHFLGLAQGLALPHVRGPQPRLRDLRVGRRAVRRVPDHPVAVGLQLAPVRGRRPLLRRPRRPRRPTACCTAWNGSRYVAHQSLLPAPAGRSRTSPTVDHYLVVAGLAQPPAVLRWDGERFVTHAAPGGAGGPRAAGRREGRPPLPDPGQLHPRHARGARDRR